MLDMILQTKLNKLVNHILRQMSGILKQQMVQAVLTDVSRSYAV